MGLEAVVDPHRPSECGEKGSSASSHTLPPPQLDPLDPFSRNKLVGDGEEAGLQKKAVLEHLAFGPGECTTGLKWPSRHETRGRETVAIKTTLSVAL